MERKYSGRGKLLLFGEHSAVYGYPACGIPLDCRAYITVSDKGDGISLCSSLEKFKETVAGFFSFIRENYGMYSELLDRKLHIDTDIPVSSGLGSSAALCCAAAEYFIGKNGPYKEHSGRDSDIWYLANELEKYFHGMPSGIDTGLACSEGPVSFSFINRGLPEKKSLPWPDFPVIYGTIPRKGNTGELVSGIRKAYQENPEYINDIMSRLGDCCRKFEELLYNGNPDQCAETGKLALKAHKLLSELELSTDIIDRIIDAAVRLGSPGGKMSGAGGGGAFWFAAENHESALRICSGIKKEFGTDPKIAERCS